VAARNSHIIKKKRATLRVSKKCTKSGMWLVSWSADTQTLWVLRKFVKCFYFFCISTNLFCIFANLEI